MLCVTSECIRVASDAIITMNTSIDPCEDFYDFACGKFKNVFLIYGNKSNESSHGLAAKRMEDKYANLLVENVTSDEMRAFSLPKNFYKACINHSRIEQEGLQPLTDIL